MHKLPQIFNHDKFGEVRAITKDGEPWFIAKDVCDALGYKDHVNAIKRHCISKGCRHATPSKDGKTREHTIIPEGDLYALIFGSQLPELETFKQWVFNEVLPAIRKTGKFEKKKPTHLDTARDLVIALERTEALTAQIVADRPKVDFADAVIKSKSNMTFSEFSKVINWGRNLFIRQLRDDGIIQANSRLPYQQYMERGWFELTEKVNNGKSFPVTLITPKGRMALAGKYGRVAV